MKSWLLRRKRADQEDEREKEARLASAEAELSELEKRERLAVTYLSSRRVRNHWGEGIEKMIRGEA